jgi:hypothetical protein
VASRAVLIGICIDPGFADHLQNLTAIPEVEIRDYGGICLECRLQGEISNLLEGRFQSFNNP